MFLLKTSLSLMVLILSLNSYGSCGQPVPTKECSETVILKSLNDLNSFLSSSRNANIIFDFNFEGTRLDINSSCKIKLNPKSSIKVSNDICLFGSEFDASASTSMSAKNINILSKTKVSLRNSITLIAEDLIIEGDLLESFNKGLLKANRALINASSCKFHKKTEINFNERFGTCFDNDQIHLQLEASPLEGTSPLVVSFQNKSLGNYDEAKIIFGDGATSLEHDPVHTYMQPGTYDAYLSVRKNDQVFTSNKVSINVLNPMTEDFEILYVMTRVKPANILVNTHIKKDLESGTREALWAFGDGSNVSIPFKLDNIGGAFHQYKEDGIYTLQLRLRGNDDYVSAPVTKIIDTNNQSLPIPRYSISAFKGDAPFTIQVEALQKFDEDGNKNRFEWTFTDKNQTLPLGDLDKVEYTFLTPGLHRVILSVYDSKDAARTVSIPVYVGQQNSVPSLPPYAVIETSFRSGTAPFKVDFSAANSFDPDGVPGQPLSYEWSFFDPHRNQNIFMTGIGMSYEFIGSGYYSVRLTVTDVSGQRNSTSIPIMINGTMPADSTFHVRSFENPRAIEVDMTELMVKGDYIPEDTYYDYGDGTLSFGRFHTYKTPGVYKLKIVTKKIDSSFEVFERVLTISDTGYPFPSITPSSYKFNLGTPISISATLPEPLVASSIFKWSLGDGNFLTGKGLSFSRIDYVYQNSGSKQVILDVILESGISRRTGVMLTENIAPYFVSEVIPTYIDGPSSPAKVGFSTFPATRDDDGYIKTYLYDWGDGSPLESTTNGYSEHTFLNPGNYNVKITIVDDNERFAVQNVAVNIAANKNPVIANLKIYQNENEVAPARVGFAPYENSYDEDGYIIQWIYDFGDGSPVITTDQGYLEHTFERAGNYIAKIRAIDNKNGLGEAEAYILIKENQAPIIGDIKIYGNLNEPSPVKLGFAPHETSSDPDGFIVKWIYNFGDGADPVETNEGYFEHIYQNSGTYNVTITAFDNKGAFSRREKTLLINENQPPVIGDLMIYRNINEPAPVKIAFDTFPTSYDPDGYITNIRYDFGDGVVVENSTSYQEHFYQNPGLYNLTVSITDNKLYTSTRVFPIIVNANKAPVINLKAYIISDVAPGKIGFEVEGLDNDGYIKDYKFDFGDGNKIITSNGYIEHSFLNAGLYNVNVIAVDDKDAVSNSSDVVINIKENQPPNVIGTVKHLNQFSPVEIELNLDASYDLDGSIEKFIVDFGDGAIVETVSSNVSHVYETPGDYVILVSAFDDKGKTGVNNFPVRIIDNLLPVASLNVATFSYVGVSLKASAFGSFDPDGAIVDYQWDWGDGKNSSGVISEHVYESPGLYAITLIIRDNDGESTVLTRLIEVFDNKLPIINLVFTPSENIQQYQLITFDATSSYDEDGKISNALWEFPNGEVLEGLKVPYFFDEVGPKRIIVTVYDDAGAKSREIIDLDILAGEILPIPKIAFDQNPDSLGSPFFVSAFGSSSLGSEITKYTWDMGDNSPIINKESFFYDYSEPGAYRVSLKIEDSLGRTNTLIQDVRVVEMFSGKEVFSNDTLVAVNFSEKVFNHINTKVSVTTKNLTKIKKINSVFLNGQKSSNFSLENNVVSLNDKLQEGVNNFTVSVTTIEGKILEQEFFFYAGSGQVRIILTNFDNSKNTSFRPIIVSNPDFEFNETKIDDSTFLINNVPNETIFIFVSEAEFNKIGYEPISVNETEKQINLQDLIETGPQNFDFQYGLNGWNTNSSDLRVTGNNFQELVLSSQPDKTHVYAYHASQVDNEQFYTFFRTYIGSDQDAIVFNIVRTSGQAKFSLRKLGHGFRASDGLYHLESKRLVIKSNPDDILEYRTSIFSSPSALTTNSLRNSFYAYASTSMPTTSRGGGLEQETKVTSDFLATVNIEYDFETARNTYGFESSCFLGIGQGDLIVGKRRADITSRFSLKGTIERVEALDTLRFKILGVVGFNDEGHHIYFSPKSDEISTNEASTKFGEEYEGTFEEPLYPPVENFYLSSLSPSLMTSAGKIHLKMMIVPYDAYDQTIHSISALTNKEELEKLEKDKKIITSIVSENCNGFTPLFTPDSNASRYSFDQQNIGGDSWTQKHVYDLFKKYSNVFTIGDISLINGATFSPHREHRTGLQADFKLKSFGTKVTFQNDNMTSSVKGYKSINFESISELKKLESDAGAFIQSILISDSGSLNGVNFDFKDPIVTSSNKLFERSCVGNIRMSQIVSVDDTPGHADHWHLRFRSEARKIENVPDPIITTSSPEISLDGVKIQFTYESSTDLDIYYIDKTNPLRPKERRLFESWLGQPVCESSYAKNVLSNNYYDHFSWCKEWEFFRPIITENSFTLNITYQDYIENIDKLKKLMARSIKFNSRHFCSETETIILNTPECPGENGGLLLSRHGGLISRGAFVSDDVYVFPGTVICSGVEILGEGDIQGKFVIRNDVSINGKIQFYNEGENATIIDGLNSQIKMTGSSSQFPMRINSQGAKLLGNISITRPVSIQNRAILDASNANDNIQISGSCSKMSMIYGDAKVSGISEISNCVDIGWGAKIVDTDLIGPKLPDRFGQAFLIIAGSTIENSKINENVAIYGSKVEDSKIIGTSRVRHTYNDFGFTSMVLVNAEVSNKSHLEGNMLIEGKTSGSILNGITAYNWRGWLQKDGVVTSTGMMSGYSQVRSGILTFPIDNQIFENGTVTDINLSVIIID